jgi:hypothetical protein
MKKASANPAVKTEGNQPNLGQEQIVTVRAAKTPASLNTAEQDRADFWVRVWTALTWVR